LPSWPRFLEAVGVYGVVSYTIAQRTTEWGIRLALGVVPRHLVNTIMGQQLVGVLLGQLSAFWDAQRWQLIPSVTRVFNLFLQAYDCAVATMQPSLGRQPL
jgi:hypothetical protein